MILAFPQLGHNETDEPGRPVRIYRLKGAGESLLYAADCGQEGTGRYGIGLRPLRIAVSAADPERQA